MDLPSLSQAILAGPEHGRPGLMTITGLESRGGYFLPACSREYPFPESINVSRNANYASVQIPGGTSELHRWTSTTGQSFSLTFKLFRDIKPALSLPLTAFGVNPQSFENKAHNRDVMLDIEYLSQFVLPTYENTSGFMLPKPPLLCMIMFQGFEIGFAAGLDYMICIVESFNYEITRMFPDGTPRIATVELGLKETFYDQSGNIVMHDRKNLNVNRFAV